MPGHTSLYLSKQALSHPCSPTHTFTPTLSAHHGRHCCTPSQSRLRTIHRLQCSSLRNTARETSSSKGAPPWSHSKGRPPAGQPMCSSSRSAERMPRESTTLHLHAQVVHYLGRNGIRITDTKTQTGCPSTLYSRPYGTPPSIEMHGIERRGCVGTVHL